MKRFLFYVLAPLVAVYVFPSVAQSDDEAERLICKKGEAELLIVPGGSERTKLKAGNELTMIVQMFTSPVDFYTGRGAVEFAMVAKDEELPADPTKCHFISHAPGKTRYFIRVEEGEGFVLRFANNRYWGIKTTGFVPMFESWEKTPAMFRHMYSEVKVKTGDGKEKNTMVQNGEKAPPLLKAIKYKWAWWPKAIPQNFNLAFPDDNSKRRYKVPIGEEILIGTIYLIFGEDSKGPFLALRKYSPGKGRKIAFTTPLDIDKINSPWGAKYEAYDEDVKDSTAHLAEARAPLVFGEGRQYKLGDEFFAICPVAKEGNQIEFDMRLFLTPLSRSQLTVASQKEVNEKANIGETSIASGKKFYLYGFNFSWDVLSASRVKLDYEARLPSIKTMEYAVAKKTALAKITDPAELSFSDFAEGKEISGGITVSLGNIIVFKINGKFFVALSPTKLIASGAVNGEEKKSVAYESKLWSRTPEKKQLATAQD